MNEQYFEERFNTSASAERDYPDSNSPVVNSDTFAEQVPVDAVLIDETPIDEGVATVDPLDEPLCR